MRVISWFSCGAASAVATKLAIKKYGDALEIWNVDVPGEHLDSKRFLQECQKWFGQEINIIKSGWESMYDFFRDAKALVFPKGAPCTTRLKKMKYKEVIGLDYDSIQIIGFTFDEINRELDFRGYHPDVNLESILINNYINKNDCFAMLSKAGIDLPMMYKLGYKNNNCIGCVKGGMGYWNAIREDFPVVFNAYARLERELGISILKDKNGKVFLDEMVKTRGYFNRQDINADCSLFCVDL